MTTATNDRELVITRLIDAPREKVFRCWTEPEPWSTPRAETDPRRAARVWS